MANFLLTKTQIDEAKADVFGNDPKNRLSPAQVSDLVSIFRGYLSELVDSYSYDLENTFLNEVDTADGPLRATKLAACLKIFQENQFTPASGFAPTAANRTGFNYSLDGEVFEVFKYAFCLFWNWPVEFENRFKRSSSAFVSSQGRFVKRGM